MSATPNNGGAAFPTKHEALDPRAVGWTMEPGLSKREYFAAMAMQGAIASYRQGGAEDNMEEFAQTCLMHADAMLAALSATKPGHAPPASFWQPIATFGGPEGRAVLVFCEDLRNTYTVHKEAGVWLHWAAGRSKLEETPTHWMPLPPNPIGCSSQPFCTEP